MKNELNYLVVFILTSMLWLASCKDKEPHINTTVVNSSTHNINVEENDDNLQLTIEVLSDTTDNLAGTFPNVDLITVFIDRNANGVIDEDLDWGLGLLGFNTSCTFYIKDSTAISGCGVFESDATIFGSLVSSTLSSDEHIVWEVSIPKKDLDDSKPLNMVVKTFSSGEGYTTFPRDNIHSNTSILSFDKVLSVDW